MKKITSLLLILFVTTFAFSQEQSLIAKVDPTNVFEKNKNENKFVFYFPTSISAKQVAETANYYKNYFTVKFDDKTKVATVNVLAIEENSRKIIMRFLVSNNIRQVEYEGKLYESSEFVMKYIAN